MTCRATLRLRLGPEAARRAASALKPDDDAFVTTRAEGEDLVVEVDAKTPRSLLRALDDVLANAGVSEDLLRPGRFDES